MSERIVYPGYTDRQIALIRCEVEPSNIEEWKYFQDHGSDVLPEPVKVVLAQSGLGGDRWKRDVVMPTGSCKDD